MDHQEETSPRVTGIYAEGAQYIRSIVGIASHRGVAIRTGVGFTAIGTMMRGGRGGEMNTIKFARAYRINPNRLLPLFGYDPIPEFDLIDWSTEQPKVLPEAAASAAFYRSTESMQGTDLPEPEEVAR